MKLARVLVSGDHAGVLDAVLAFHLDAGVDTVVVLDREADARTSEILETYARAGYVHVVRGPAAKGDGGGDESMQSARLARLAASELGADWVLWGSPREFWWPRGAGMKEVLDAVPARYGLLHGFPRYLCPGPDDGRHAAERATLRRGRSGAAGAHGWSAHPRGGPIAHRATPAPRPGAGDGGGPYGLGDLIPMRSWAPLEVLALPSRDQEPLGEGEVQQGLEDGSLVPDTRLRDALRTLAGVAELDPGDEFPPPAASGEGRVRFPRPSVVDEALYAIESASADELELDHARRALDELEARVAALEAGPRSPSRSLSAAVTRLTRTLRTRR